MFPAVPAQACMPLDKAMSTSGAFLLTSLGDSWSSAACLLVPVSAWMQCTTTKHRSSSGYFLGVLAVDGRKEPAEWVELPQGDEKVQACSWLCLRNHACMHAGEHACMPLDKATGQDHWTRPCLPLVPFS